jgi:hypothetical protein
MTDPKQSRTDPLPGGHESDSMKRNLAGSPPVPDPTAPPRSPAPRPPQGKIKAGQSENERTLQALRDREVEFRKRLPPWAKVLATGSTAVSGSGNAQSQLFHASGGPELLTRLCSADPGARESAENMILTDVLATALWYKKRADGELGALLNHDDKSICDEGLIARLLAVSETQAGRIESAIRTRRCISRVGPLNLVVKGGSAPLQTNINIAPPGDNPHGSERGSPMCPEETPTAPSNGM